MSNSRIMRRSCVSEVWGFTERSPVGSSDPKKLSVVPYKTQGRQNRRNVDEKASIFLLLNIIHGRPQSRAGFHVVHRFQRLMGRHPKSGRPRRLIHG